MPKAEALWDASYAVGETADPALANCKWTFYRRNPDFAPRLREIQRPFSRHVRC